MLKRYPLCRIFENLRGGTQLKHCSDNISFHRLRIEPTPIAFTVSYIQTYILYVHYSLLDTTTALTVLTEYFNFSIAHP